MSDVTEIDRLDEAPHPRETVALIGHRGAERALLEAYRSGRIHHAWILGGPEGIGKATLAYRMAKFVLAHPDPAAVADRDDLSVAPDAPAARQVTSQSHVDLKVLRRTPNDDRKTFGGVIKVDEVRQAVSFFGNTAGGGGWRIAIVDAADDLNAAGANALLKVLEEPPARALFLIVSHQPGRLLPTIRSRCRRLELGALSLEDTVRAAASARPDLARSVLETAARIAQGSVRRALALAEGDGVAIHQSLLALLARLPEVDVAAAHALADRCAGKAGDANFALLLAFLEDWLHERLLVERGAPVHRLARWAEVWDKVRDAARDVEVFNLERKPLVLSTLSMLARASRS